MKRVFLLFCLIPFISLQAELDTRGIPAGANGLIYLDQENFSQTDFYKICDFLNPEQRLQSTKLSEF